MGETRGTVRKPPVYGGFRLARVSILFCRRATRCTFRCARRCGEIDNPDNTERLPRNQADWTAKRPASPPSIGRYYKPVPDESAVRRKVAVVWRGVEPKSTGTYTNESAPGAKQYLRMSGAIVGNGRLHFRYVINGDDPTACLNPLGSNRK